MMAPKTMSCRDVALRIQSYLDGEIDEGRRESIARHLDACRDCGLEADVFQQIKDDLTGKARPADPAALQRLRAFSERIAADASEI